MWKILRSGMLRFLRTAVQGPLLLLKMIVAAAFVVCLSAAGESYADQAYGAAALWVLAIAGVCLMFCVLNVLHDRLRYTVVALALVAAVGQAQASTSADGTMITAGQNAALTDAQGHVWTIANGLVMEDGQHASYSARVTALVYTNGVVWQENADNLWWAWSGRDWSTIDGNPINPLKQTSATGQSTALAPLPSANPCSTGSVASAGQFGILDGKIYAPDQSIFIPRGVNVMQGEEPSAAQLVSMMPKINFVRYAILGAYSGTVTAASLAPFVNALTDAGLVVGIDFHCNNANNDCSGGGAGTIFQGADLAHEQAFFDDVASTFKTNAKVWFFTNNEPPTYDLNGLAQWQLTTVNTIRKAGNNNPIMLEAPGYDASTINVGLPQSVYSQMFNTAWDMHFYSGNSKGSTNQAIVTQAFNDQIAAAQKVTSAGGAIMPVFIGETGNSQNASTIDANWPETYQAVTQNQLGVGYAAWAWDKGTPGDGLITAGGGLSDYGVQIRNAIQNAAVPVTTASTGCVAQTVTAANDNVSAGAVNDNNQATTTPTPQDITDQMTAAQSQVSVQAQQAQQQADSAQQQITAINQQKDSINSQIDQLLALKHSGVAQ